MTTYTHLTFNPYDLTGDLSALLAGITPANILGSQDISQYGRLKPNIMAAKEPRKRPWIFTPKT